MELTINSKFKFEKRLLPDDGSILRFEVLAKGFDALEANRNVFCVDIHGNEVWRVAHHKCPHGDDPFVGIDIAPDGIITGLTWDGWRFEINRTDGSLKKNRMDEKLTRDLKLES